MVFEDISIFEDMDNEWLEGLVIKPKRICAKINNPRSAMMLNPLKLKHLNKIDQLDADIVTINLEDGVAPQMKKRALFLTAVFISHLKNSTSKIIVRVNPIHEGGKEEIEFLNKVLPDAIRVAKIRDKNDVKEALSILNANIKLHLSIETKESLLNLASLNVQNRVECSSLGIMDMLNSLGIIQSVLEFDNPTIEYILSRFLVDARVGGIYPIGFTYQEYEDLEGFKKWCELQKRMGYSGVSCLGPKQVEIANKIFASDEKAIKRAKEIKELFESKTKEGESGFMHKSYGFIDEPIYKDALLILGEV